MQVAIRSTSAALGLFIATAIFDAQAGSCIWYVDEESIRQVQADTNQVTQVVTLRHPRRLAMNSADCGVWAVDKEKDELLRFNAEGTLETRLLARQLDPRLGEIEQLEVDPYDGSLWISDDERVYHISAAGRLLGGFAAPEKIERLRVALDQSVWAMGKRTLWRFDSEGILVATYSLKPFLTSAGRHFEIDNPGGVLWLADEHELSRLDLLNPGNAELHVRHKARISGMALDPFTGNLWVAQQETLLGYSRTAALSYTVDLEALQIRKPEKLAFDPVSRSLWVGAEKSVSRFTDDGQFVMRFAARDGDEALGAPAFRIDPTLALVRPPENALTNNPRPTFTLAYGAQCNGQSCPFASGYFRSYQLDATLNGNVVGPQFSFDASVLSL